jgi:hypothetical protein
MHALIIIVVCVLQIVLVLFRPMYGHDAEFRRE